VGKSGKMPNQFFEGRLEFDPVAIGKLWTFFFSSNQKILLEGILVGGKVGKSRRGEVGFSGL